MATSAPLEAVTESTMAEFMYRAAGSPAQAQGGYASQALAWAASTLSAMAPPLRMPSPAPLWLVTCTSTRTKATPLNA